MGFIALATYFFLVRIEMSNLMPPAGGGRSLATGVMKGLKKKIKAILIRLVLL